MPKKELLMHEFIENETLLALVKKTSSGDLTDTLVIGVDIGGTNANSGMLLYVNGQWELIVRWNTPSQQLSSISPFLDATIKRTLDLTGKLPIHCCIGIAGIIIDKNEIQPTNLSYTINRIDIETTFSSQIIYWLNDFELVAWGWECMKDSQKIVVNKTAVERGTQQAFIGAGTGLGTAFKKLAINHPIVYASEAGHIAAPCPTDSIEKKIFNTMQEHKQHAITYEDILSGKGMSELYRSHRMLQNFTPTAVTSIIESEGFRPDLITRYADQDLYARITLDSYAYWYGQFAQTIALASVASHGLIIAGGIAARNPSIVLHEQFQKKFFTHAKHSDFLKTIPIFLCTDYTVSLYGAAKYIEHQHNQRLS